MTRHAPSPASVLERIYLVILVVIMAGIVIHAPVSVGFGVLFPDYGLLIKSWKEMLLLVLIPLAGVIVTRRKLWGELLGSWLFRAIGVYTVIHFVTAVFLWQGVKPGLAGLAVDLRYLLFFILVYIAVRVLPRARRQLLLAATIGAFVVVCFATLQLFLPPDILTRIGYSNATIAPYLTVDKNPNYIRVNSTLRGPNPLGAYAGIVLSVLAAALVKMKLNLRDKRVSAAAVILGICSIVALWVSYSRSALVAGMVGIGIVVFNTTLGKLSRKVWIALVLLFIIVAGGLFISKDTDFVSNVLLHENTHGGSSISSNEGHVTSLSDGMQRVMTRPFGAGVGTTGSASLFGSSPFLIENQYLFIGHEVGWAGALLFIFIFVMIMVRLWQVRSDWLALGVFGAGVSLALIGLLLPVWTDDTVSIIWWGMAAIVLGGRQYERTAK